MKLSAISGQQSEKDSISEITDKGKPNLSSVIGVLANLATAVEGADAAPTQGEKEVYKYYRQTLDDLIAKWKKIEATLKK